MTGTTRLAGDGVRDGAASEVDAADSLPLVAAAAVYAQGVLRPNAVDTEATGVDVAAVDRLRELGLLRHRTSARYGGAGLTTAADRRLHELIGGADLSTWLVWAQHAGQAPLIEDALGGREPGHDLLGRVLRGEALSGAALSDVRRWPDRYVAARRIEGRWRFSGTVSWYSGAGLGDAVLTAAVDDASGTVVTALLPVDDRIVPEPLDLRVGQGSRTARLRIEDVDVDDALVLRVEALAEWARRDRRGAVDVKPHVFGLASTILDELAGEPSDDARAVAEAWRPVVHRLRATAYDLADLAAVDPDVGDASLAERRALRVRTGEVVTRLARALVVARAGRAFLGSDTAQLHLRSAHFVLVQAQEDPTRAAQLAELARTRPEDLA